MLMASPRNTPISPKSRNHIMGNTRHLYYIAFCSALEALSGTVISVRSDAADKYYGQSTRGNPPGQLTIYVKTDFWNHRYKKCKVAFHCGAHD